MELVTSPWESAEQKYVREMAGRDDIAELSRALLLAKDPWHEGFGVTTVLRGLQEPDRLALAETFVEHAAADRVDAEVGNRGLVLLAAVSRDIADATWCEGWEELLLEMADQLLVLWDRGRTLDLQPGSAGRREAPARRGCRPPAALRTGARLAPGVCGTSAHPSSRACTQPR